jgi:long-chain acyl-CoA synthetase
MENHPRYVECCAAGERSGLYYTCINSHLTPQEVAYILNNSESKLLITSKAKRDVALATLSDCPSVELCLIVDDEGDGVLIQNIDIATAKYPTTPIADEVLGTAMLYSSGTTGKPKGVLRPLPVCPPSEPIKLYAFLSDLWRHVEDMTFLVPAPLYHAAPHLGVNLTVRAGGTSIIMERFDAELFLKYVERFKVTDAQLVPTMFSRMLKLPERVRSRYELSTLRMVVHGAAPCPVPIKERMIEWWGPIIHEYYSATEGLGLAWNDSAEWLAHRGTVGKVILGTLHVLDENMNPCPTGTPGKLWFTTASPFEYFNDLVRTAEALSPDGTMSTVNDIGYVDEAGYVYLTDRATFMIISGGVNIYPQECENLLITHPKVADAAVFGVPNEDLGEEVKAVVQPMPDVVAGPALEQELMAFCAQHLARYKCPRSVDFENDFPRLPTGKLYKHVLRDRYWQGRKTRII